MAKILIVGGVAGGASAAARLRRLSEEDEIILFERGPYISYANCGLPYYIGGTIEDREDLFLQDPAAFSKKFQVDVRVLHEVVEIDRENKEVVVHNKDKDEDYRESYDDLILSTGSSPLVPPIPGIDSDRVMTLWTVPDTDKIKAYIEDHKVKSAAVIGGGFIGLEMAENLRDLDLDVALVEMEDQVMKTLDKDMAQILHRELRAKGVKLILKNGVKRFEEGDKLTLHLQDGKGLETDLAILSIGVRPNSSLAKEAGLDLNQRGGVLVSEDLKTKDPHIYAIGDVIEVKEFQSDEKTMVPLAGPANKQGRMVANILKGEKEGYKGTQGTSVAKVFDLDVASTGYNERALQAKGYEKGKDYEAFIINQKSHAGYYPGAQMLFIKLVFSLKDHKVLGAQIVGGGGVDKRIDVLATTIRFGGTIKDLTELELAYAPPYSSAKDPVNMAGFVAENIVKGLAKFAPWDVDLSKENVVDVREVAEVEAYSVEGAINIPLATLRDKLDTLDKDKNWIVLCAIGVRAYNGYSILRNHGFKNLSIYPGGTSFYRAVNYKDEAHTEEERAKEPRVQKVVNCTGKACPRPTEKVLEAMDALKEGDSVLLLGQGQDFLEDVEKLAKDRGLTTERKDAEKDQVEIEVRK